MRLCLATSSYPLGPSDPTSQFVPEFVEALVERGCQVTVLTQWRGGDSVKPSGYDVRRFGWRARDHPVVGMRLTSPGDLASTASLLWNGTRVLDAVLAEDAIDHCLALWAIPSGYYAWRACPPRGVKYSVWALGADIYTWGRHPLVRPVVRRILQSAALRFADGIRLAAEVEAVSGRDCTFMATSRRLPALAPGSPHVGGGGTHFLYVGRFELVKGADVLVEAMGILARRGVESTLTMFGSGSLEGSLRRRIDALALGPHVHVVDGMQPAQVLAAQLGAADCLVIPSRMESIPVVLSDGLQAGVPLLVTDVGDMGDLARQHGLPEPIPPGDAVALAAAMEGFASDRPAGKAQYERARQTLLPIFDSRRSADGFLDAVAVVD